MSGRKPDAGGKAKGAGKAAPEATLDPTAVARAVDLVAGVVALKGNHRIIPRMVHEGRTSGIARAVRRHDTPALYDWFMGLLSMQGISDRIAWGYIERWGNATYADVSRRLATTRCACPKLEGFAAYTGCGYRKDKATCARPQHLRLCPVRQLPLRKGLLNIQAVSLHRWLTDVCEGDLVAWVDRVIATARAGAEVVSGPGVGIKGDGGPYNLYVGPTGQVEGGAGGTGPTGPPSAPRPPAWLQPAKATLVTSLSAVEGVSDKLANMTLAALMIGGRPKDPDWFAVAAQMVTVDTLIHNMLERTGVLAAFGAEHAYGPRCYGPGECEAVIYRLTERLRSDAVGLRSSTERQVEPGAAGSLAQPAAPAGDAADVMSGQSGQHAEALGPSPIEVQKALWRFCTANVLDFCNAGRVGGEPGCRALACPVRDTCRKATGGPGKLE